MAILASELMDVSRKVHLNDPMAARWTNTELLPYLKEAITYLEAKMTEIEAKVTVTESAVISVPAGITNLSGLPNYPTDLISVVEVLERLPGQTDHDWMLLEETNKVSNIEPREWSYQYLFDGIVHVAPATRVIEVYLRYNKMFSDVAGVNTDVSYLANVRGFISARMSAMAAGFGGGAPTRAQALGAISEDYLAMAINIVVHEMQDESVRHLPYRFGR